MYTKWCVSCGTVFAWSTGQKSFCPECAKKRRKENQSRYASKRRGHPLLCPSCGSKMIKGRRMCRLCARVRRMNSSAATSRLRRRVALHSPPINDSVPGELFAPNMTTGGWTDEACAAAIFHREAVADAIGDPMMDRLP